MQTSAIAKLGKNMAGKIGEAAKNNDINQVVRYMSHAALGCGIGLATANVHGSDKKNKISCLSGAGGAVVGEVIADTFKSQQAYNKAENDLESALAELGMDEKAFAALTEQQQAAKIATHTSLETAMERLLDLKKTGVDLAKLGSALGAFIANADVNIAADAGANAAENNALWFFFMGAYSLYKAYCVIESIKDLIDKFEGFSEATPEKQKEILIDAAIGFGIDLAVDLTVGKTVKQTAGAVLDELKKRGVDPKFIYEFEYLYDCISNDKLNAYKPGKGQAWHNSHSGKGSGNGDKKGDYSVTAKPGEVFYKTTKEATVAAKKLGFEKTKFKTHGETVFHNKKKDLYISRDVGSGDGNGAHNGGVWKMAKSVEKLGSKKGRLGTFDANLNQIGD
ncbi:toxin C-terminal domain-containing protein [uncultured Shewanella sp.]|uniref:toxin C-terminal domain-containing protein n=1 Tax=uncultured Shewanella sp. TaxID=173975 RepID=UPI002620C670|nr:toxin C-terminal domain-containing protein [uncultured Shewanella sp.]